LSLVSALGTRIEVSSFFSSIKKSPHALTKKQSFSQSPNSGENDRFFHFAANSFLIHAGQAGLYKQDHQ
jgi:hypothetical protein